VFNGPLRLCESAYPASNASARFRSPASSFRCSSDSPHGSLLFCRGVCISNPIHLRADVIFVDAVGAVIFAGLRVLLPPPASARAAFSGLLAGDKRESSTLSWRNHCSDAPGLVFGLLGSERPREDHASEDADETVAEERRKDDGSGHRAVRVLAWRDVVRTRAPPSMALKPPCNRPVMSASNAPDRQSSALRRPRQRPGDKGAHVLPVLPELPRRY
jgi:hypothetical protein